MVKWVFTLAGTGAVASLSVNGQSWTLNQNVALTAGSLYEFSVHLTGPMNSVSATGATLINVEAVPVED